MSGPGGPRALAWRTDLALLAQSGSIVEQHGSADDAYVVVRTPDNPTFHWGNFLLLPHAPPDPAAARAALARSSRPASTPTCRRCSSPRPWQPPRPPRLPGSCCAS